MNTDQLAVWRAISDQPATYYVTASEEERNEFRNWVRGLLQERAVTVDFEKADGAFRSMKCTLREDLGAKYSMTESKNPRNPNPDVCVVWDTAQQAWRSFRWDRVKRIQFDLDLG
jgi:hypothetical protein